jgi:RND family efflux transporter MFP subunit
MSRSDDLLNELKINRRGTVTKKKRRWPFYLGIALALAIVFGFLSRSKPIEIETVNPRSAAESGPESVLDASGYVTARRIATVSSKVTGKVKEVFIEEGQRVKEGEVLARLDVLDSNAQLQLSQAQVDSSKSQLAEAQAQLKFAQATYNRNSELAGKQLVSKSALESSKAELDSRKARLVSLQKAVAVSEQQRDVAQIGVDNTIIRAPFDGVIIAKAAQPGEMISPISAGGGSIRTGIGTLVDMDSLEVQVDVNEAYIGRVTPQMPIEAVLNAYPEWKIPGEVIAIIPTADRSKATVKVRVALKSKDPRIVPDMGVRVSFLEAQDTSKPLVGFWVPSNVIVKDGEQQFVFTVVDGKAKRIQISTIDSNDNDTLISKGVSKGDSIIVTPSKDLKDGSEVALKTSAK